MPKPLSFERDILIYMESLYSDNTNTNSIMDLIHSEEPQIFDDLIDQNYSLTNDNVFSGCNSDPVPEQELLGLEF